LDAVLLDRFPIVGLGLRREAETSIHRRDANGNTGARVLIRQAVYPKFDCHSRMITVCPIFHEPDCVLVYPVFISPVGKGVVQETRSSDVKYGLVATLLSIL
jgi:hypothetical protein